MRSKVADRILANMPEDVKIFTDKYADLVVLINQILREKGYTQKSLAESLGKQPSEIHKWLSGEHNFTLRSLAKLEAELGETLIEVPSRKTIPVFESPIQITKYSMTLDRKVVPIRETADKWEYETNQIELSNVG